MKGDTVFLCNVNFFLILCFVPMRFKQILVGCIGVYIL